jgi:outer membrane protein OmpA-like peptidoglycan-associated protein
MRSTRLALLALLALASCTSPPKPPTADESRKRPANVAAEVELQVCRSELHNTRIVAAESSRAAQIAASAAAAHSEVQRLMAERVPRQDDQRNAFHTVLFVFNSTHLELPEAEADRLLAEARSAPLILLRGRTDGTIDTPAENRVARARAQAVEAFLVRGGVAAARIRTTWQATGDHVADNDTPEGRALNRRVEIEIYRAAPRPLVAEGAPPS